MPTAKLFNMAGDQVGEVALSEAVFGVEPNESVLHDSVKNHLANCRQGTQSALTKGEVSYTTAKPWRQKGTGRARAGYKGSPVWTHGGVAFAPKPRDYSYTLNKKVKRLALKSALSAKAAAGEILVVDGLAVEEIKTAPVKAFLTKIGAPCAAMDIMSAKVEKSMNNSINRKVNCDTANADKVVAAAQEQIDAIRRIERDYGLDVLPEKLQSAALLRIANPEASLADLAMLSYPPVTKSCLNYRLKKLMEFHMDD